MNLLPKLVTGSHCLDIVPGALQGDREGRDGVRVAGGGHSEPLPQTLREKVGPLPVEGWSVEG